MRGGIEGGARDAICTRGAQDSQKSNFGLRRVQARWSRKDPPTAKSLRWVGEALLKEHIELAGDG